MEFPGGETKCESTISVLDELENIFDSFEEDRVERDQHDIRKEEIYSCAYCPFKGDSVSVVAEHQKLEHEKNLDRIKTVKMFTIKPFEPFANLKVTKNDPKIISKHKKRSLNTDSIAAKKTFCKLCGICCESKRELRNHFKISHKEKTIFNCNDCQYGSNFLPNLKSHKETKHESKIFKCEHCEFKSTWNTSFLSHQRDKHNIYQRKSKYFGKGSQPVKCQNCDYIASSSKRLDMHKYKRHNLNERSHVCEQCDFSSVSEKGLKSHILFMHPLKSEARTYICTLCNTAHYSAKNLREHRTKAHGMYKNHQKDNRCELCDFVTNKPNILHEHIEAIHEGKQYPCHLCNYVGQFKRYLAVHIKEVHGKEESHFCDICSFVSNKKRSLAKHKKNNHTEKLFQCKTCSYKAPWKWKLIKHQKVHDQEASRSFAYDEKLKKFMCDICEYATSWKYELSVHKARVHEGIVFPCNDCDYEGKTRKHLSNHNQNVHTKKEIDKLFRCEKCNYKTKKNGCLITHILRIHKENNEEPAHQMNEEDEENFLQIVQQLRTEYKLGKL